MASKLATANINREKDTSTNKNIEPIETTNQRTAGGVVRSVVGTGLASASRIDVSGHPR